MMFVILQARHRKTLVDTDRAQRRQAAASHVGSMSPPTRGDQLGALELTDNPRIFTSGKKRRKFL
jgi:hypothetical protein